MFQLPVLRKEIQFNKEMEDVINVLKAIASSEFYLLQKKRKNFEDFQEYLKIFFQSVFVGNFSHPFLETKRGPNYIVLITSDAGFLGELNMSVINSALEMSREQDVLVAVGKQGSEYLEEMGKKFTFFPGIGDEFSYEQVDNLRKFIMKDFLNKKATRTIIVYPHFVSFAVSDIRQFQLLPCKFLFQEEDPKKKEERILIEPSLKRVVENLVRIWLGQIIHSIFWESKLSEWSSRVIHLERGSTEIREFSKYLNSLLKSSFVTY